MLLCNVVFKWYYFYLFVNIYFMLREGELIVVIYIKYLLLVYWKDMKCMLLYEMS